MLHDFFDNQDTEARYLYKQIQQRHNDILKLEADLRHLQQLFVISSVLIQKQTVSVDKVEQHVASAVNSSTQATAELTASNKLAKSSRKKKFMLAGAVASLAAITAVAASLPAVLHR